MGRLTDVQVLEAVQTYMQWPMETEEQKLAILNHIWYVTVEGKLYEENI